MLHTPIDRGVEVWSVANTADSATKARDFEGPGGPETKQQLYEEANPGDDDVTENVRQGTETRRP